MRLPKDTGRRPQVGRRLATLLAALAILSVPGAERAFADDGADDAAPLIRWSLLNGLEVALIQRPTPAVAVQVWYRVGSKNDPAERRGTAHMFEHLMYQGSARVKPEGHSELLGRVGGHSSALTTEDATAFANLLPARHLELVLELEAERMRSLLFRDSAIARQRERVEAELRRDLQNPLYAAVTRFLPLAFADHPYSWTSGGVVDDVGAIGRGELEAFYNRYYRPNNALLVIVGNVEEKRARAAVDRYFAGLERGSELEAPSVPEPTEATRVTAEPGRVGFVMHGYRIPEADNEDIYPLQLLSLVLARGESSRLYRRLVGGELAVEAGGQAIVREHPGLFMVFGAFTAPDKGEALEKALAAEIARVRKAGVSAAELKEARNQARAGLGFAVSGADGMAQQVGTSWANTGDPARFRSDLDKLAKVSIADIKRVANEYLAADRRVTLVIPVGEPQGAKR